MATNRASERAEVEVYAKTLLDQVNAQGGLDAVLEARSQMEQIVAYNRSHIELTAAATDAERSPEERASLVRKVFEGAGPALQGMLGVMVERESFGLLPRVLASFNEQVSRELGVTVVDVVTRVPLDDHLRDLIKNKASAELGGQPVLREQVDGSMLGGIVMSANGRRIDASMDTMLSSARATLRKS